jgi:hypothetical protein
MSIVNGQTATAADFLSTSSGAADSGKVAKLDSNGKIPRGFLKFGGTGADGALSISSGTTTLSFASAQYLIKNYTSISITGTAALAFSNPHANGSVAILKSKGDVTVTSSTVPAIDVRSMGAAGGVHNATTTGNNGTSTSAAPRGGAQATIGSATYAASFATEIMKQAASGLGVYSSVIPGKNPIVFAGAGGGAGSNHANTGGDGGIGSGGLYIECGGNLNITSTFNASGTAGGSGSGTAGGSVSGSGGRGGGGWFDSAVPSNNSTAPGDGGGGGGAGAIVIVYDGTLTANTATFTVSGGGAGTAASGGNNGSAGGDGYSLVISNTELC